MIVHGYELTSEWKNSQQGEFARARKEGKAYFLKRYQTPVAPLNNGALDAKTYAHNKQQFEKFVDTRTRFNALIRTIVGAIGIVIPCEEFIEENRFIEATEFVEGAIDDAELAGVIASLLEAICEVIWEVQQHDSSRV